MINTSALINELAPHQNKKKYINIDDNITRVSKQMHLKMSFGETGVRTVIAFEAFFAIVRLHVEFVSVSIGE